MYYYTTSTLDINPETQLVNPETIRVTPETQLVNPETQNTPSPSGSSMTCDAANSDDTPFPSGASTTSDATSPTSTPKLTTAARIAALEQLILENSDSPQLRRVDMARKLGVGLSRIKDDLRLLAAQGKVVFVGIGSHSGHWHLEGNPETEAEVELWLSTPGYALLHGSRGRHTATSTPKSSLLHTQKPTSTPRDMMSPESKARVVAHTAVNCALAVVQTPFVYRHDIACLPHQWQTPFYFTRRLWRNALSPLQPLLPRG